MEHKCISVLQEYNDICKIFDHDRIFSIDYSNKKGVYIKEACDYYYCHVLTKEECLKLSEMFKDIASCFEE